MTAVFLKLLNMSIAASWLVLAVIVLRLFLKKSPGWIVCLLWGVVALRLIMPFSVESPFSLIPSAEVIPMDMVVSETPAIYSGIPVVNNVVNPVVTQRFASEVGSLETLVHYAAIVWLAGVVLLLIYSAVTYIKLYRQVAVSICCRENIYLCDDVESPFLLGIFRPRVYLPSDLPEEQQSFVLAHEKAHIKRRDHLWKPFGFLLLTLYWFNPLMWVAYILLCRDIERACDEKVVVQMDAAGKVGYSAALVVCSVHRRMVMACPVAFGEISVKSRIKGVLNYKKPVFWVVCLSLLMCLVTAACFLTNPQLCIHAYQETVTTEPTCTETGLQTRVCSHCQHSYTVLMDQIAHSYDSGVVTEPATCTHMGSKQLTCISCGAGKTEMIELTAHTLGEPIFIQEANCTHEGSRSATCSQCSEVFVTQVLPVNHNHDLQETVLKEASCKESGEGVLQCSRCDYSESCTYEKLPHDYVISIMKPTCSSSGWETSICIHCGSTSSVKLAPSGHNFVPTGRGYRVCSECGWTGASGENTIYDNGFSTSVSMPSVTPPTLPTIPLGPQFDNRTGLLIW